MLLRVRTIRITTSQPRRRDFKTLAPLQIELVLNSSLADDHFDRERPVILEEIRSSPGQSSKTTVLPLYGKCALIRLPYRRPVLGPTAVVEKLTAEQMPGFSSDLVSAPKYDGGGGR